MQLLQLRENISFTLWSIPFWAGCWKDRIISTVREPFVKGFLKGPFKPMYGCAPLLLLAAKDLQLPVPLLLVLALIIPSAVEYASGWLLKAAFHRQWWDYKELPYQLHGHICLKFSLYWWGLATACIYLLQPMMEGLYTIIEPLWGMVLPMAALLFLADLLWTCRVRRRGLKGLELGEG